MNKQFPNIFGGRRLAGAVLMGAAMLGLAACGGGGGGDAPVSPQSPAASAPSPTPPAASAPSAAAAPAISAQPQAQSVREGGSTTFSVTATGVGPFSYRWQRNGVDVEGATASSHTVSNQQLGDNQSVYTVRVSNAAGSVTSQGATLEVQPLVVASTLSVFAGDAGVLADPTGVVAPANGVGLQARFATIRGLAADGQGNVYVAEVGAVRKVSANGTVTTVAGDLSQTRSQFSSVADGAGSSARFSNIQNLALAPNGDLYVSDGGLVNAATKTPTRIRKIDAAGAVTTVLSGADEALAALATGATLPASALGRPAAVAVSPKGEVHVLDHRADLRKFLVRKVAADGTVTTVPGGDLGSLMPTSGVPKASLRVDGQGSVYVSLNEESGSVCLLGCYFSPKYAFVVKLTPAGAVTVLAGGAKENASPANGAGGNAAFLFINDIALDPVGNLYAADAYWDVASTATSSLKDVPGAVRKVSAAGAVTTPVGVLGSVPVGQRTLVPGALPGRVVLPNAVAVAPDGTLYLTSGNSHLNAQVILKVGPQ